MYGNSMLHRVARGDLAHSISSEIIKLLLEAGAAPNETNNEGDTPLHVCLASSSQAMTLQVSCHA